MAEVTKLQKNQAAPKRQKKKVKKKSLFMWGIDMPLVIALAGLLIIGLVMIYSSSSYTAGEKSQMAFLRTQLFAEVLGIAVSAVLIFIPNYLFRLLADDKVRKIILILSAGCVLLLLTGLGVKVNGATRWIKITDALRFQPAEIVKIAIIIYLAGYIADHPLAVDTQKGYAIPFVVIVIFAGGVYKISDNLSSAIIIAGIGVLMLFAASKNWKWQAVLYPIMLAVVVYIFWVKAHTGDPDTMEFRYKRILIWEDPVKYMLENGYQTLQALYAIGSGGVTGKGVGRSIQKLGTIPEVHNDMIYSVVCEETGLVGAAVILILFGVLIYRCMKIGLESQDTFGKMLCLGVMLHFAIQAILNILVVTNTMPNTGVSLPFISYGGSSAVFLMIEIGLVLRISRDNAYARA